MHLSRSRVGLAAHLKSNGLERPVRPLNPIFNGESGLGICGLVSILPGQLDPSRSMSVFLSEKTGTPMAVGKRFPLRASPFMAKHTSALLFLKAVLPTFHPWTLLRCGPERSLRYRFNFSLLIWALCFPHREEVRLVPDFVQRELWELTMYFIAAGLFPDVTLRISAY